MLEATPPPKDSNAKWKFEYWFVNPRDLPRGRAQIVDSTA